MGTIDLTLAEKAFKLSKKGLRGKAISTALGGDVTTTKANILAAVGYAIEREESNRLSEIEIQILLALASIERERRLHGDTSSCKTKHIAWRLRVSEGIVGRHARKRLAERERYGEGWRGEFGMVRYATNGHISLTDTGWAVVHAFESAQAKAAEIRAKIVQSIDAAAHAAPCGCMPCHGHPEREATFEECAEIAAVAHV